MLSSTNSKISLSSSQGNFNLSLFSKYSNCCVFYLFSFCHRSFYFHPPGFGYLSMCFLHNQNIFERVKLDCQNISPVRWGWFHFRFPNATTGKIIISKWTQIDENLEHSFQFKSCFVSSFFFFVFSFFLRSLICCLSTWALRFTRRPKLTLGWRRDAATLGALHTAVFISANDRFPLPLLGAEAHEQTRSLGCNRRRSVVSQFT